MWKKVLLNIHVVSEQEPLGNWINHIFKVQKHFRIWPIQFRCVVDPYSMFSIWFCRVFWSHQWLSSDSVCPQTAVQEASRLVCICFFAFWSLGEKVSIGVTTLLSMTVFLMLVADSMPPNSDSLPLIGTGILLPDLLPDMLFSLSLSSRCVLSLCNYYCEYSNSDVRGVIKSLSSREISCSSCS